MRPNGLYVASFGSVAFTTGIGIIELQAAANSQIEIWRAWVGPAEGTVPVDEVQEIGWYRGATGGTGTGLPEQEIQGTGDAVATAVSLRNVTIGASPENMWFDAYHTQVGYLYHPIPEERLKIGSGGMDNIGMWFPVAPDASMTISAGIVWAEYVTT
jgi:hypothetical protein